MKKRRPLILVVNDDGITSRGIKALVEVASKYGRICLVAPDKPQSGMGHAITVNSGLNVSPYHYEKTEEAYSCTGTPADCVKLAIYHLLKEKPDLCLSGINHGSNASINIIYSGTMSAAIEGALEGVPSAGISLCNNHIDADLTAAKKVAKCVIEMMLNNKHDNNLCLNVNIPDIPVKSLKGMRICRQGKGNWKEYYEEHKDKEGNEFLWLTGKFENLEKLTKANLRFVVSVAKQYQNRGLSLQDLINEGNLGLLKAAKRFDHSKGFKFISYAVWWIRQTIHQALAENSRLVRLPVNKINTMHKITQATSRLEQEFGREPTNEEVAEITQLTEEDVKTSQRNYARTISMDAPLGGEDDDGSLYDVTVDEAALSPETELLKDSLKTEITRTLSTLPPREADVLKFYYGLGNLQQPMLVEEIARRLEISPERVRQIKDKAIRRLRHNSRSKILKTYLG